MEQTKDYLSIIRENCNMLTRKKDFRTKPVCLKVLEMAQACLVFLSINDDKKSFTFKELNPAAEAVLKVKHDAILNCDLAENFPGVEKLGLLDALSRVSNNIEDEALVEGFYADERIQFSSRNHICKLDEQTLLVIFEDTSSTVARYTELEAAKNDADKANQVKSKFLSNISHELRTPLNGLLGMLSLLSNCKLKDEEKYYLELAKRSGKNLLDIVSSLLDFIKLDKGEFFLQEIDFELMHSIRQTIGFFQNAAEEKGVHLVLNSNGSEIHIKSDQNKIIQIFSSILSNAIKFSDNQGSVFITVNAFENLEIIVEDQGIGIEPKKIEAIFVPLEQLESPYIKQHGGVGLGLTIAKELLNLLNGHIEVESEFNVGTTVTLSIPVVYTEDEQKELSAIEKTTIKVASRSILIAEDDPVTRAYLKYLLRKQGFQIEEAIDGRAALERINISKPDLLLMDIGMPNMDGVSATKAIREQYSSDELPIIALTAYANEKDHKTFRKAGINSIQVKPYDKEQLFEHIERYLKR